MLSIQQFCDENFDNNSAILIENHELQARYALERGALKSAEDMFQGALSLRAELVGEGHTHTIEVLVNLSLACLKQSKMKDALSHSDKGLTLAAETYPTEHPIFASGQFARARVLIALCRFSEAQELLKQCLASRRELLGPHHVSVAECLWCLGEVTQALGSPMLAETLLQQALVTWRKTSEGHPSRVEATGLLMLASNGLARGMFREAVHFCQQAEDMIDTVCGHLNVDDDVDVAMTLLFKSQLLRVSGVTDACSSLLGDAELMCIRTVTEHSLPTVDCLLAVAEFELESGVVKQAGALLPRCLDLLAPIVGRNHPTVARTLGLLAVLKFAGNDVAAAMECVDESMALMDKFGLSYQQQNSTSIFLKAKMLHALGKFEENIHYIQQVFDRRKSRFAKKMAATDVVPTASSSGSAQCSHNSAPDAAKAQAAGSLCYTADLAEELGMLSEDSSICCRSGDITGSIARELGAKGHGGSVAYTTAGPSSPDGKSTKPPGDKDGAGSKGDASSGHSADTKSESESVKSQASTEEREAEEGGAGGHTGGVGGSTGGSAKGSVGGHEVGAPPLSELLVRSRLTLARIYRSLDQLPVAGKVLQSLEARVKDGCAGCVAQLGPLLVARLGIERAELYIQQVLIISSPVMD